MPVSDYFQPEVIESLDTDLSDEVEAELREWLNAVLDSTEELTRESVLDSLVLTFIAGRGFQAQEGGLPMFNIPMDAETVGAFISYLLKKEND